VPPLWGSGDRIVSRAPIPSARRRHGDVRLVRRADGILVVQTLLFSASLRRGVHEIAIKERGHWPADDPMHADSARYLALLERARDEVLAAFAGREDRAESRQKLLLETIVGDGVGWVAMYEVDIEESADVLRITGASPLGTAEVSPAYARASMEIILRNAFAQPALTLEEALTAPAADMGAALQSQGNPDP
jgi:hypothetical protein